MLDLRTLYAGHIAHLQRAYAEALEATGYETAVIHSGTPLKRAEADDQYWPLRPVPSFQHWLPLAEPDCALVIRPGSRPLLLWLKSTSFWEQPPPIDLDYWQPEFDIIEVESTDALRVHLPREGVALLTERRSPPEEWRLDAAINPAALVERLDKLRAIKTPYEVACIAEANRRAAEGHKKVADAFFSDNYAEIDLHLLFLGATRQDDPETPYKNIVALGPNAATLHHIAYGRTVSQRPAQSLLIDAGAAFQGYTSDVTRTYVKGTGATADTFAELLRRVEAFQQRLCSEVEVGLPFPALHERAHRYVADTLAALDIVRLSPEAMVEAGVTRAFFPHGLGHALGLQCHDVGCTDEPPTEATDWLRNTSTIAPGQVFTIEPGIYFIARRLAQLRESEHTVAVNWPLVDLLATLGGIRIEDNIHVTGAPARPIENLTRAHLP
jgi:Xaa-Pro dipeptidase